MNRSPFFCQYYDVLVLATGTEVESYFGLYHAGTDENADDILREKRYLSLAL